jgi:hypothetical protein
VPDADVRSTDLRKGEGDGTVRRSWRHAAMRWSGAERIAGGACLLLLITLFLPWWGVAVLGARQVDFAGLSDGMAWVVLIAALAVLAFLVLCAGSAGVRFARPPGDRGLLAGATSLNLLLVVLAVFVVNPAVTGPQRAAQLPPGLIAVSLRPGAVAALLAAAAAAVAASVALLRARPRRAAGEPAVIRVPAAR